MPRRRGLDPEADAFRKGSRRRRKRRRRAFPRRMRELPVWPDELREHRADPARCGEPGTDQGDQRSDAKVHGILAADVKAGDRRHRDPDSGARPELETPMMWGEDGIE